MKLTALMPARNESWVLGLSVRVAAMWADEVILLDHASTDNTHSIAIDATTETGKVWYMREGSAEWAEMAHRQRMLAFARARGATHIAIVDADEILSGNLLKAIRPEVERLRPGQLLQIPMRNMHRSINEYRSDRSAFGQAITTVAFADDPALQWADKDGYPHHQREPKGSRIGARIYPSQAEGGVMHLQFSNWRRLIAKHALYKMSERVRFPQKPVREIDRLYSMAPNEAGLELSPAGADWWAPYAPLMHHLNLDAEPWQEGECRRLLADHGRDAFAGLNLFGVV